MPPDDRPNVPVAGLAGDRPTVDVTGLAARRSALRILDAVTRRGETVEQAAPHATRSLSPADRALALAIVGEVLRWGVALDGLIDGATRQPLPGDAKARMVLRIALAQALRLGTPPHAAIATALPIIEGGPRRLVHGVLGAILRSGAALPDAPPLPPATAARWAGAWGPGVVAAAGQALAAPPPLDLVIADPGQTAHWAGALEGTSLLPGHVRIARGRTVESLPGYEGGAWWVQDIAASLPARLLGRGAGTVLDLCAAPGGKAMQLAAQGWQVIAVDKSARRLERLSDNFARTALPAPQLVAADLGRWQPDAPAEAILLDAPCSATGTFRRHPEVLARAYPAAIAELAAQQRVFLTRVAGWLKPGGRLVYAVCSLEPEEGEAQAEAALAAGLVIDPIRDDELPAAIAPARDGTLRTLPGMLAGEGGLDGFYVARFRRP